MPVNENLLILRHLYRRTYENETYYFRDLIKEAIQIEINSDSTTADGFAQSKLNKIWADFKKDYVLDLGNHIVPLFDIIDEYSKRVRWIGIHDSRLDEKKRYLYKIRPEVYKYIDRIDDRKYEGLACVVSKLIGAENVYLTPPGNEGGIDFVAKITFPSKAHFLFGNKGPIRIIGQCKKYATKDKIGHMKEFTQTLTHVYNLSYRAGEILPDWFKDSNGPIIGWHIAHSGHQSGALNYAKNYGIVTSTTKELVEIIAKSKVMNHETNKITLIDRMVKKFIG